MNKKNKISSDGIPYIEYSDDNSYTLMQECIMDKQPTIVQHKLNFKLPNKNFLFVIRSRKRYSDFLLVKYTQEFGFLIERVDVLDENKVGLYSTVKEIEELKDFPPRFIGALKKCLEAKKLTMPKLNAMLTSFKKCTKKKVQIVSDFNYSQATKLCEELKDKTKYVMAYKIWV